MCCYLLLPKEYEGRLPMVICLQGHTKSFYPVSLELDGVLADLGTGRLVREGQPFSVRLTPAEEGKTVSVSVIAGGEDITDRVWSDGVVSIPAVTCDITVTAASA